MDCRSIVCPAYWSSIWPDGRGERNEEKTETHPPSSLPRKPTSARSLIHGKQGHTSVGFASSGAVLGSIATHLTPRMHLAATRLSHGQRPSPSGRGVAGPPSAPRWRLSRHNLRSPVPPRLVIASSRTTAGEDSPAAGLVDIDHCGLFLRGTPDRSGTKERQAGMPAARPFGRKG